ncbi:MAG TPA: SH3 domain-containing protein [Thermomicrobiales bacterium]|nr:SH3 domain-containing protein [Thermomicrobiales bacterium]
MPHVRSRALGAGAMLLTLLAMPAAVVASSSARSVERASFAAPSGEPPATACVDADELQFLSLINDYRAKNGVGALKISGTLSDAADRHSEDMDASGVVGHTMSDGTTVAQNLQANGYAGDTFGENIAAGADSPQTAFQTWEQSPEHNANMLRGAFGAIGIARIADPNSQFGTYWTTIFGGSFDQPATLCADAVNGVDQEAQQANSASPATGTTTDDVTLRGGPEADYPALGTIPSGSSVDVLGSVDSGFLPVAYNGLKGWVAQQYVKLHQSGVTTALVNFRVGPSYEATIITTIPKGTDVALDGSTLNGFLGAAFDGQTGWIDRQYVTISQPAPAPSTAASSVSVASAAPVAASPTDAPVAAAAPAAVSAATLADTSLRAGPSTDAGALATIPAGSTIALTGHASGGFLEATFDGQTGWVDAAYVH